MKSTETTERIDGLAELQKMYAWQKQHMLSIRLVKDQISAIRELRATAVAIAQLQKEG